MRLITILATHRSIHPFVVGVFFLGAAAICWLVPNDDHVDVESSLQDSRRLIEQGERLLDPKQA